MKLLVLPFLFLASAFFSAAETAFFALRRVDLLKWKREGNRTAGIIEKMLERPSRIITSLFIGNELVNVSISSVTAALLIPRIGSHGEVVSLAAGTLGILILGDITPKCIVWPRAHAFSLFAARPMRIFSRMIAPVRVLLEILADGILRMMGSAPLSAAEKGVSEREFRALVDAGERSGSIERGERELIHNIFEMTDRRAGEIMTPLADVHMVPAGLPRAELLEQARRYRRSRIPVYEGTRGNVVGILYLREMLHGMAEGAAAGGWADLVKPPFVVPTSKKLPLLLREFQKMKIHLALVVDEFGEPVGIVTLEDLLEELFGEIREEHDRDEEEAVRRGDDAFLVRGKMPIHRFNEMFSASLPDREWDTVAGLLLHEFSRLPGRGDTIVLGRFRFTVERVKGIRIVEVLVRPVPEESE